MNKLRLEYSLPPRGLPDDLMLTELHGKLTAGVLGRLAYMNKCIRDGSVGERSLRWDKNKLVSWYAKDPWWFADWRYRPRLRKVTGAEHFTWGDEREFDPTNLVLIIKPYVRLERRQHT